MTKVVRVPESVKEKLDTEEKTTAEAISDLIDKDEDPVLMLAKVLQPGEYEFVSRGKIVKIEVEKV